MRLEGKKAFVTGGTFGIGQAIVHELLKRRCRVITCARHPPTEPLPAGVAFYACDLGSTAEREALVERLDGEHPDLSIVIHNAAVQHLVDFHGDDLDEIRRTTRVELALNLEAPILLTAGLLPLLVRQPEASIVNVTTGLALAPKRSSPVYCASKAALRSFTRSLRYQMEKSAPRVRVQEVLPPLVETRMTAGRGAGKLKPATVAASLVDAIEKGVDECYVGKSRLLKVMMRLAPSLAYRVLKAW